MLALQTLGPEFDPQNLWKRIKMALLAVVTASSATVSAPVLLLLPSEAGPTEDSEEAVRNG